MPKLPKAGLIAGIVLVAAALGIASVWQAGSGGEWPSASPAGGDPSDIGRRHDELQFLKAAFDRLEAEAKQNPNSPALRSLRAEQEAVVGRMRDVARPLSRERLPNEVRALIGTEPANGAATPIDTSVKAEPRPAAPPVAAAPAASTAHLGELKPGLASIAPAPTLILSRDPALSGVVLIARPRLSRPAPEASPDKPGERQPGGVNATANGGTRPPAKPQVTLRAPEKIVPAGISGAAERAAAGPVAILGR